VAYHRDVAFERITTDPHVMGGVPCIRGTRIPVTTVVEMVAEGMTPPEIVGDYPQLAVEDVQEALRSAPGVKQSSGGWPGRSAATVVRRVAPIETKSALVGPRSNDVKRLGESSRASPQNAAAAAPPPRTARRALHHPAPGA
jgi:uncharacterized protein (DUF433 family)